jgi:ABC-type branched-subunit amino acid transport system substrate-binding protein
MVGMSAAFRGASRGLSIELWRGSTAWFEHVNAHGGVHGRKIVIRAYNDDYDPIPAIENTIQLVERDGALLLFDYMGTPTVTRVLPLLKKYHDSGRNVYLFFPFTGAAPHRQYPYDEFVFNLRASYHQETVALVEHFLRIGRRRIAVFYQADAYGRSGWDGVRRTLAEHDQHGEKRSGVASAATPGLTMVAEATYRRGTGFGASMQAQVDVLRVAEPDAIISVGTYAACAALVRDARDAGWDVPIANLSGVDSENLLQLLVDHGRERGRGYTQNLINSQVVPSYESDLPAARDYRRLMDEYHPMPPTELLDEPYPAPRYSFIGFEGFLNARLLVKILEAMDPAMRPATIKRTVEGMSQIDLGIDVPVSFGLGRHQGLNKVYCTVAKDGEFVPLGDPEWQRWQQ